VKTKTYTITFVHIAVVVAYLL